MVGENTHCKLPPQNSYFIEIFYLLKSFITFVGVLGDYTLVVGGKVG